MSAKNPEVNHTQTYIINSPNLFNY